MIDRLVYVAGPLSLGDLHENLHRAVDAGRLLLKAGIPVIVPHLTVFMGLSGYDPWSYLPENPVHGFTAEDWYAADLAIVRRCSAVLRLPGSSRGGDLETAEAALHGIPVFGSVEDVIDWAQATGHMLPRRVA